MHLAVYEFSRSVGQHKFDNLCIYAVLECTFDLLSVSILFFPL